MALFCGGDGWCWPRASSLPTPFTVHIVSVMGFSHTFAGLFGLAFQKMPPQKKKNTQNLRNPNPTQTSNHKTGLPVTSAHGVMMRKHIHSEEEEKRDDDDEEEKKSTHDEG